MYELIILGFLARYPMHGYLIAKIINDMIGPLAKVSNGRLYPLLTKLEADGLIAPVSAAAPTASRGERRQGHTYEITEAGRERLHQLMMDTVSNPGEYRLIFWYKVPYFEAIQPAERLYLIDHYANYCLTHIFHLTHELETLERDVQREGYLNPVQLERSLFAIQHYRTGWQHELESARTLRARESALIAQSEHHIDTAGDVTQPRSEAER